MSFLSGLGHVIGKGLGFVPLPGASTLGKIIDTASGVGDVLGGASKTAEAAKQTQQDKDLQWEKLRLQAPATRAKTSLAAALAANYTPKTANWGGPGSGRAGKTVTYSGGSADALAKAVKDPMVMQMLQDAEAGKAPASYDAEQHPGSSVMDKIMGGGAVAGSLTGAIGKALTRPKATAPPVPYMPPQPTYQPYGEDDERND